MGLIRNLILQDVFGGPEPAAAAGGNGVRRPPFALQEWGEADCLTHFRFEKGDIPRLVAALKIPDVIQTRAGHVATGVEALCMTLKRLAYPNRLEDIRIFFNGRSSSAICEITNFVITFVENTFGHLLVDLRSHHWLTADKLQQYSNAVAAIGAAVQNCWAFLDGTIRPICRPSVDQQLYYSGHKRTHCLKYQSLVTPDGLTISCMGPFEGRRHDAGILRESGLYGQLEETTVFPEGHFVIYGDQAYGIRELILCPFPGLNLNPEQEMFNNSMSTVREAVEWIFGKVIAEFAFVDFKKNQKLLLQDLQSMYKTATLLANCHSCLYGNQTSQFFNMNPIPLEQYLNGE
nr:unnamed protein product [Callosobruchus chinensis]